MDAIAFTKKPTIHVDGLYFGLDKQAYLDDPALGSTDMKKLSSSPSNYQWARRNRRDSTDAQELGTAVHLAVLEGRSAFERRYMRGPDQDGMSSTKKRTSTTRANDQAATFGKICIKADAYDRCLIAATMITANPDLAIAFTGGAAEVSVFWTEHRDVQIKDKVLYQRPIRKKARFDYLKPRGIGDLKRVANKYELPFQQACINDITNYRYTIQAKHYLDARAALPALIKNGHYFGLDAQRKHFAALLDGVVTEKQYGFQFVFWQGERAPLTWSLVISSTNEPLCATADLALRRAEQNYLAYLAQYGEDGTWVERFPVRELHQEDLPPWYAKHYAEG